MRRREFMTALGGAVALWPLAGTAQQGTIPVIGWLHPASPVGPYPSRVARFAEGLRKEGFEPGRNVAVEYRWAEGHYDRIPALAGELLALKPALLAVFGPPNVIRAAVDAVPRTIPVVFGTGGDPVAAGIVASLARPGGNVTGTASLTNLLDTKRVELLRDLLPDATAFGMIYNPNNSEAPQVTKAALEGAQSLARRLMLAGASTPEEVDKAFAAVVERGAHAMLVGSDAFINSQRDRIIALAARYRLPAIYNAREAAEAGGLISYGSDFGDDFRLTGAVAGKILHGAKPADLPVQQPTKFELVVNLKTASALGLTVPPSILARADEIIE